MQVYSKTGLQKSWQTTTRNSAQVTGDNTLDNTSMPSDQKTTDFLVLDGDHIWKSGLNKYKRERSKKAKIPLFWSSQVLKPKFKRRKEKDSFDYHMGMLKYCRQLSGNLRPSINTRAEFWLYVSKCTNLSTFKYFIKGIIYISRHNTVMILDT